MCPGFALEGWLRWFAHPLLLLCAEGRAQDPTFVPNTQFFAPSNSEMAVGCFFVFLSFGPEFTPAVHARSYFESQIGSGNPLQYSCLESPVGRGAWWAAVHGVTQSWTRTC